MVKAVLFDVDGVLIHPFRFRDALTRDHGITPEMTAPFFRGPFMDCVEGRTDVAEILPRFLDTWGWRGSVADFLDAWLATENAPDEDALAVVAQIRRHGIPCFVASTQERRRAQYMATSMGFDRLFDGLFFSSEIGASKPQSAFYTAVANRLGHHPGDLLFFDDVLANVDGARQAGWRAEQFTTVERLRADVARHTGSAVDRR